MAFLGIPDNVSAVDINAIRNIFEEVNENHSPRQLLKLWQNYKFYEQKIGIEGFDTEEQARAFETFKDNMHSRFHVIVPQLFGPNYPYCDVIRNQDNDECILCCYEVTNRYLRNEEGYELPLAVQPRRIYELPAPYELPLTRPPQ